MMRVFGAFDSDTNTSVNEMLVRSDDIMENAEYLERPLDDNRAMRRCVCDMPCLVTMGVVALLAFLLVCVPLVVNTVDAKPDRDACIVHTVNTTTCFLGTTKAILVNIYSSTKSGQEHVYSSDCMTDRRARALLRRYKVGRRIPCDMNLYAKNFRLREDRPDSAGGNDTPTKLYIAIAVGACVLAPMAACLLLSMACLINTTLMHFCGKAFIDLEMFKAPDLYQEIHNPPPVNTYSAHGYSSFLVQPPKRSADDKATPCEIPLHQFV